MVIHDRRIVTARYAAVFVIYFNGFLFLAETARGDPSYEEL